MLNTILTFLVYLGKIILFILALILYRFIIKPVVHLLYYRIQGFKVNFFPVLGYGRMVHQDYANHNDCYYRWKQPDYIHSLSKVFISNFADFVQVTLADAELLKHFYFQQDKYVKFEALRDLPKLIMGDGTLLSEGQVWKRHRKITSSAFNYEYLKEMIPEMVEITQEFLENQKDSLYFFDFMEKIQLVTGEIVGRLFFGEKFSEHRFKGVPVADYIAELMAQSMSEQSSLLALLFTSRVVKLGLLERHKEFLADIKDFRAFMLNIAKERLKETTAHQADSSQKKRVNLIDIFYQQRVHNSQDAFTDTEIVDEFITFFVAGMDTTAHLITFMSYYYLTNPECQQKVLDEVDKFFSNPSKITIDDLNQMNYMGAMAKETLRMAPPTPFLVLREAIEDNKIGNIKIKAGTLVNVAFLAINYNPEYHQEPHKFMPERWIDKNSLTRLNVIQNPYIATPFSAGSRNCLGQHLAIIEAKVIFGLFLKTFEYSFKYSNYKMKLRRRFLYEPANSLIYNLKIRKENELSRKHNK